MKTWTSAFQTKVEKLQGEQPCRLVDINYGTSSHLYLTDADQTLVVGGNSYYPYIFNRISVGVEIDESEPISSVANLDLILMRNATTDVLLSNHTRSHDVVVSNFFIGLADADKCKICSLKIEAIVDVTQSQFTLKLKQLEIQLKNLPIDRFDRTSFPQLLKGDENEGMPIILGDVETGVGVTVRKSYRCRKNSSNKGFCTDVSDNKFLVHNKLGSTSEGQGYAYKFESRWNLFAFLEADGIGQADGNNVYSVDLSVGRVSVNLNLSDATYPGVRRKIFILPEIVGRNNTATNWKNAIAEDTSVYCEVIAGGILELNFADLDSFLKNADCVMRYACFYVSAIEDGATATFYIGRYGGTETNLGTATTTGEKNFSVTAYMDLDTYKLNDYYLKVTATTGYVRIQDVMLEVVYKDGMEVHNIIRHRIDPTRPYKVEEELYPHTIWEPLKATPTETISNDIFLEAKGCNNVIRSYAYNHPVYCIYYILCNICGVSGAQIDTTSFDDAYTYLSGRICGRQIQEIKNAIEYLSEILMQTGLRLFRDADNKFKLMRWNYNPGGTIPVFRDLDMHDALTSPAMVYQMTDFVFYENEKFYNKFILNYHYNAGRNLYDAAYLKDRSNDADLATSYSNYGSDERAFELDCNWLRMYADVNALYLKLEKYWKQFHLIAEFDTNLVGTKLELGDIIRTNHKAQTWNSNAKDFQVIGLEQSGNTIHVKAIEIIS